MFGAVDDERTFKVQIATLLEHLSKNREEHIAIVEEAQVGFRKACIKKIDNMLEAAKAGKTIDMHVGLVVPSSHIDAFDNAIGLLGMVREAGEETVEITSTEYQHFVQNAWGWSERFSSSNSGYTEAR